MRKTKAHDRAPRVATRSALPHEATQRIFDRFVGRETMLRQIGEQLDHGTRLVTLWGPAGVGKTRLALECIRGRKNAWFCDLAEVTTSERLCTAVVASVPALSAGAGRADVVEELGHALSAVGPGLLVLDNLEQVALLAAQLLPRWLERAPRTQFLVTSRAALEVRSERLFEVAPLLLPPRPCADRDAIAATEAVTLFVERARAVRADYALTERDAPLIAEIVCELDGLPLAIELAAAQLELLGAAELRKRLSRRLDVLVGGPRDASSRQQTLRSAIAWSWDLLEPYEQAALAQCSVFRGGFSIRAAESVIDLSAHGGAPPILVILRALRTKSLIQVASDGDERVEGRCRLLESVREFAFAELQRSGDEGMTRRRHAAHYAGTARELAAAARATGGAAISGLRLDLENLLAVCEVTIDDESTHAALDVLVSLASHFAAQGSLQLYCGLLDGVLAVGIRRNMTHIVVAEALNARGTVRRKLGRIHDALEDHAAALELARGAGALAIEAEILCAMASCETARGGDQAATRALEQALALCTAHRERALEAEALALLADICRNHGDVRGAEERFSAGLRAARAIDDTYRAARILCQLTACARERKDERAFARYARDAAASIERTNDKRSRAVLAMELGLHAAERAQYDEAQAHFATAITIFREIGHRLYEAIVLDNFGCVVQERSGMAEGAEQFARAVMLFAGTGADWREAAARADLGSALAARGALDDARYEFDTADALLAARPHEAAKRFVDLRKGHLDLALAQRAEEMARTEDANVHRANAAARLASTCEVMGTGWIDVAVRLLRRALDNPRPKVIAPTPRSSEPEPPPDALLIGSEGAWFRPPGGPYVDLSRRRPLRRLLCALSDQRRRAPGRALSLQAMLDAGWPGEQPRGRSGASRVHVAVATLRRLGLGGTLRHTAAGYLLDPDVPTCENYRLELSFKSDG